MEKLQPKEVLAWKELEHDLELVILKHCQLLNVDSREIMDMLNQILFHMALNPENYKSRSFNNCKLERNSNRKKSRSKDRRETSHSAKKSMKKQPQTIFNELPEDVSLQEKYPPLKIKLEDAPRNLFKQNELKQEDLNKDQAQPMGEMFLGALPNFETMKRGRKKSESRRPANISKLKQLRELNRMTFNRIADSLSKSETLCYLTDNQEEINAIKCFTVPAETICFFPQSENFASPLNQLAYNMLQPHPIRLTDALKDRAIQVLRAKIPGVAFQKFNKMAMKSWINCSPEAVSYQDEGCTIFESVAVIVLESDIRHKNKMTTLRTEVHASMVVTGSKTGYLMVCSGPNLEQSLIFTIPRDEFLIAGLLKRKASYDLLLKSMKD